MPTISIIMGVYNDSRSLKKCINSVLAQSFSDFEFIICDDASTDLTASILKSYENDSRIVLLQNEKNKGLAFGLNRCLLHARGEFIARIDADDQMLPSRLERELQFLKENPNVDIVGTFAEIVDDEGKKWGTFKRPLVPTLKDWVKGPAIIHPTILARSSLFKNFGTYNEKALRVEDYELWMRLVSKGVVFQNIPEILYRYRLSSKDYSKKIMKYRFTEVYWRWKGFIQMKVPLIYFIYVLKPLVLAFLPNKLFEFYQRRKKTL